MRTTLPRLVPDDPRALEAERWADEVLQRGHAGQPRRSGPRPAPRNKTREPGSGAYDSGEGW